MEKEVRNCWSSGLPGCEQSRKFLVELNRLNAEWKHDGLTVLSVRITPKEPAEDKVTGLPAAVASGTHSGRKDSGCL